MFLGHGGDGFEIVAGSHASGARGRNDACGYAARQFVFGDCGLKVQRVHVAQIPRCADLNQIVLSDAGDPDRTVNRAVHLIGAIDAQLGRVVQTFDIAPEIQRAFAHGQYGSQCRGRRAVLDHALVALGQAKALAQPVQHARFHLGCSRRGLPQHALRRDDGGDEFRQHRCRGGIGVEIGKKAGVLPMGDARHHDPLEIGHDRVEPGAGFRRAGVQLVSNFTRRGLGPHGTVADRLAVVRPPVSGGLGVMCEVVPAHDVSPSGITVPRSAVP